MPAENVVVKPRLLNSWKEISNYMGRGVRTVQRWEVEFRLPVRRPAGRPRSAVLALTAELDEWLSKARRNGTGAETRDLLERIDRNRIKLQHASSNLKVNLDTLTSNLQNSLRALGRAESTCASFRTRSHSQYGERGSQQSVCAQP